MLARVRTYPNGDIKNGFFDRGRRKFWRTLRSMRGENFTIKIYLKSLPHGLRFLSMSSRLF
jgi:hypothetical protein